MTQRGSFHFFYLSVLAETGTAGAVPQILRISRQNNLARGIRGALVFDGQRFAQLLEGDETAVRALARAILADTRHERIRVIHEGQSESGTLFQTWRAGYAGPDLLDDIPADGQEALAWFTEMLPACDLD